MASTITADNGVSSGSAGLKSSADSSGVLALASGTGTTAITIDTSQNVGIGTSSPNTKLQVNSAYSADTTPQATILESGGGIGTAMFFGLKSDGTRWIMSKDGSASTAYPMAFYTGTSERARIDSSGNLLVAKTTTSTTTRGAYLAAGSGTLNSAQPSGGAAAVFTDTGSGSQIGAINLNGTSTSYATSSDYRLKENIAPMTGALSVVQQLKPCTYKWKADGSDGQGFIAHELAEVVPDCVTGEKDAVDADGNPVYQGIDTSFLVATLTAAIQELATASQEQQALITTLTERITALEAK